METKLLGGGGRKSTQFCLVLNNPFNDKGEYLSYQSISEKLKEQTDGHFIVPPISHPAGQPVIPRHFLGKEMTEDDGTDLDNQSMSTLVSEDTRTLSAKEDAIDFVHYCLGKKFDERQMVEEIVKRLVIVGFELVPREMVTVEKDDTTGEVKVQLNKDHLWLSPDKDQIYILIRIERNKLESFAEKKQVTLQTNPFSFMGGAGTAFNVKLCRKLSNSVLDNLETFEDHLGRPHDPTKWKPWGFRFEIPQRTRLVERMIKDKYHGCGIEFDEMIRNQVIFQHFFPVHNKHYVEQYKLDQWASIKGMFQLNPLSQPLDGIVHYFGEKVALYFYWIGSYAKYMIPLAAVGTILMIYYSITGVHNVSQAFYAALVVLWAIVWTTEWQRKEKVFAFDYGTDIEAEQELVRDEFEGKPAMLDDFDLYHTKFIYPLTLEVSSDGSLVQRQDSPLKRQCKRWFFTYPVVLSSIALLIYLLFELTEWRSNNPTDKNRQTIANAITIGLMVVFAQIFSKIITLLNDYENNRTESEYENSLILKNFAFSFCNAYSALFILALWSFGIQPDLLEQKISGLHGQKSYCQVSVDSYNTTNWMSYYNSSTYRHLKQSSIEKCNCSWTVYWKYMISNETYNEDDVKNNEGSSCAEIVKQWNNDNRLDQLFSQLLFILVFKPLLQNFQELFGAKLQTMLRIYVDTHGGSLLGVIKYFLLCGCWLKKNTDEDLQNDEEMVLKTENGEDVTLKQLIQSTNGQRVDLSNPSQSDLERRVILWRESQREPYSSTCDDFHEIVVQFGYMAMFAMVFPIGPLVCVVFNALEIRIDAIKLMALSQRSRCQVSTTIGAWNTVFRFLTVISIVTNSYSACFLAGYVKDVFGYGDFHTRLECFIVAQYVLFTLVIGVAAGRSSIPDVIRKALVKQRLLRDRRSKED